MPLTGTSKVNFHTGNSVVWNAGEIITILNAAKGVHIVKITTPTKVVLKKVLIH